jgi:methylphosphotriester-DNA--protein-cysteine methyltransferase
MATATDMSARCRAAYLHLQAETGKVPSMTAVAKAVGTSSSTVSRYWDLITGVTPDKPTQVQVAARRRCLSCRQMFSSGWAGHRVCARCKSLDAWRSSDTDYSVMSF